jgi:hypothetical protein
MRTKYLAMSVLLLGIVVLAIGSVFIGLAYQKNAYITSALRDQKITLGLSKDQIAQGQLVDNAQSAQVAAETLNAHLKSIAPTYGDLMAANSATGGKYDPTNPKNLTYTQGLNMENSLNIAVLGFGVIQETIAVGIVLIIIGLLAGATGLSLIRLTQKQTETEKKRVLASHSVAYQPD